VLPRRRSNGSGAAGSPFISPRAPTSFTASGCVARNRRIDAPASTWETAHDMFQPGRGRRRSPRRARHELLTTGGTRAPSAPWTRTTRSRPRKGQIARLARDGLSNPEIGAQLFISPRDGAVPPGVRSFAKTQDHFPRSQLGRLPVSQF